MNLLFAHSEVIVRELKNYPFHSIFLFISQDNENLLRNINTPTLVFIKEHVQDERVILFLLEKQIISLPLVSLFVFIF